MTLTEVRDGIIHLLREKTEVPNITGEDLELTKDYFALEKDGNEEVLPTLQVDVQAVTMSTAAAGYHRDQSAIVDIAYLKARYTSNRALQEKLDEIAGILLPYFCIGDRAFSPILSFNITAGIGHCVFTMEWTDTVPFKIPEPLAGEIEIKL